MSFELFVIGQVLSHDFHHRGAQTRFLYRVSFFLSIHGLILTVEKAVTTKWTRERPRSRTRRHLHVFASLFPIRFVVILTFIL